MHGITITLIEKTQTGIDALNHPTYSEAEVSVDNVLVGEPTADEIANTMSLYGKKAEYTLAIPKGDTHKWEDTFVILPDPFAGKYKTIGHPTAGIDALIPLSWNKKVKVERYG
jgi:hypothetical protein